MKDNFLVFDLETQRGKDEVGGWSNIAEMRMSVGVVWDNQREESLVFYEDQVEDLIALLVSGRPVVGFNHIKFDYLVLSGYRKSPSDREDLLRKLSHSNNLDMLLDITGILGHRLKLDSLAKASLGEGKTADGLIALKWWRQYLETNNVHYLYQIRDYCIQDVLVTRDVFQFGVQKKKVYYDSFAGVKSVNVNWHSFASANPQDSKIEEKPNEQLFLF